MAELADALDSGSSGRKALGVRFPFLALIRKPLGNWGLLVFVGQALGTIEPFVVKAP